MMKTILLTNKQTNKCAHWLATGSVMLGLAISMGAQASDMASDINYKFKLADTQTCVLNSRAIYKHATGSDWSQYDRYASNFQAPLWSEIQYITVEINYNANQTQSISIPCHRGVEGVLLNVKNVKQINSYSIYYKPTKPLEGKPFGYTVSSSNTPVCTATKQKKSDPKHRLYENVDVTIGYNAADPVNPAFATWTHGNDLNFTTTPTNGDISKLCRTYTGDR